MKAALLHEHEGLRTFALVLATEDVRDLVYHAGSPLVDEVWQAGQRVA